MTSGRPQRADAEPETAQGADAVKKGDVAAANATRGPESGDTSLAPGAAAGVGLPFAKLPVEFGRYRVEKLLGTGAMGAVYLARDLQLDRKVALKVPKLARSGSAALLTRMEREAKALAQLDHPNICKVYDFDERNGVRYMALEYVEGETLKSLLQRLGRKRKPAEAVAMIGQLARALEVAHEKGVVHRDLKPENIMRRADGRLVIMDFGLNRQSRMGEGAAFKTQAGTVLGTPAYMSPEQAAGRLEQVDARSDIYALGVMLYEMLTGELPFSGTALEIMGKKALQSAPSPLAVNPKLPEGLASICDRLLARKREDRPATCAEVAAALTACDLAPRVVAAGPAEPLAQESMYGDPFAFMRESESGAVAKPDTAERSMPSRTPAGQAGKSGSPGLLGSGLNWWSSRALSIRLSLAAAGVASLLLGIILLRTEHGMLRVEIDHPSLSVRIAGETITVENDGVPVRIRASSPQTLEVYQNGVAVETPAREVSVRTNENRLVKVSLIAGQVAVDGKLLAGKTESPSSKADSGSVAPSQEVAATNSPGSPPATVASSQTGMATVSSSKPAPNEAPPALPGSRELPVGEWLELVPKIDPANHSILGAWNRSKDMLVSQPTRSGRIMIPFGVEGEYTVCCRFKRVSGQDLFGLILPIDGHQFVVVVDTRSSKISGIGWVNGLSFLDSLGKAASVVATSQMAQPGHTCEMTVRVSRRSGGYAVEAALDGETFATWAGAADELSLPAIWSLPSRQCLGIIGADSVFEVHSVRLLIEPDSYGWDFDDGWGDPRHPVAAAPPQDVEDSCRRWNDKFYLISREPMTLVEAQEWARKLKGRLLTISSRDEQDFIERNTAALGIWTAGWRPSDKSAAWRDGQNRLLRYIGQFGWNQPDVSRNVQWNLCLWMRGSAYSGWDDVGTDQGDLHACLEWGEESPNAATPSTLHEEWEGIGGGLTITLASDERGSRPKLVTDFSDASQRRLNSRLSYGQPYANGKPAAKGCYMHAPARASIDLSRRPTDRHRPSRFVATLAVADFKERDSDGVVWTVTASEGGSSQVLYESHVKEGAARKIDASLSKDCDSITISCAPGGNHFSDWGLILDPHVVWRIDD